MLDDPARVAEFHDALWAVLWNRRYDDVDEPVWLPESSYWGILAFASALDAETTLCALDTGEALVVFRCTGDVAPVGSRVRVLPSARDRWRLADATAMGLGVELRFDDQSPVEDVAWIATLREALERLRDALESRRDRVAARRAQLGALNEPPSLEEIWRDEMSAITGRVTLATEYTPEEHASLARARAKGARSADEEERRVVDARKKRFAERGNEEVARFREERWPAIRERGAAAIKKYADYRTEVVRLEDTLQRLRGLGTRANNCATAIDRIERAGFHVRGLAVDAARLDDPEYAEELLRSVELLHAAIPQRAQITTTSFSAYRAPTAGPSVTPPRL